MFTFEGFYSCKINSVISLGMIFLPGAERWAASEWSHAR